MRDYSLEGLLSMIKPYLGLSFPVIVHDQLVGIRAWEQRTQPELRPIGLDLWLAYQEKEHQAGFCAEPIDTETLQDILKW